MSRIGELDSELVSDYLDDALSPAGVEYAARRLAEEPDLALAMHELRVARAARLAAWRSLEPSYAEETRLADRIVTVVRRDCRRRKRVAWGRLSASAAIVAGLFVAGWLSRGRPALLPDEMIASHRVAGLGPAGASKPSAPDVFHVALVDHTGNVVRVQEFSRIDDAREFARDLVSYQTRRRAAEHGSAVLVSDQF